MATPHLQPPGAGLPFIPRIYLRWFGRRVLRWKYSWDSAPIAIGATAERLYRAVANLPADVLQRPVLVPPMPGIEDSSRYWSPAMVIQHLNITCEIFSGIIVKLSRGEAISERRGPADVKPAPDAGRVDVESFQSLHTGVGERICAEAGPDRERSRFPHPWFGPMTARDWFGLFAAHLILHEKQLQAILKPAPSM